MAADYKLPLTISKRVRFFDGQFLQDQDFVDEQKYHLSWQNRHHRLLHVSGVVEGLTVYIPANSTLEVKIRPGMAIDADGRQILLSNYSLPIKLESESNADTFWVYIAYHQNAADKPTTDQGVEEFTRWSEEPYYFAHAGDSPLGVDDKNFGSPDWNGYLTETEGPPPPVLLAKVTVAEDDSISIDESVRHFSGLRLPGPNTAAPTLRTDTNGNVGLWLVHNNDTVERVTVTPQGRLGVGTTSPQTELEVRGFVRGANNADNYTELGHGGSHGFVNMGGTGRLEFRHDGDTKMTLSDNARLGIGIGSFNPASVLHIKSSTANDGLIIQTGDNSIDQGIAFRNSGNAFTWHLFRRQIGTGSTANLHIAAGLENDITALSTVALFTPDGKVGIGTAPDAAALLDVAGTIRFRGSLQTSAIGRIDPFYIRGTGQNHNGNRRLMIGNTAVYNDTGRGLTLTIISKADHSVVSSTNFDVYGSEDASNNMAAAMNAITRDQIGVITSWDAWIRMMTDELRTAMQRVGLYKGANANGGHRSPYAAIFEAANTNGSATAVEVLYSADGNNPHAEIRGWLMDGGFMATGAVLNALTGPEGNDAAVTVAQSGNVGIGTTSPTAKLEVNGAIRATQGQYMDVKSTTKLNAAGWHRIIQSPDNGGHNAGIFEIRWSVSGRHGHVRFAVAANFGDDNDANITILHQSAYGNKIVETIRLLMKDTNDPHYVEFYFNGSGNDVIFNIYQLSGYGWSLVEPTAGAVPSGYAAREMHANLLFGTRSGADDSRFWVYDNKIWTGNLTAGAWPANDEYVFFGTNRLDQSYNYNYALLQASTTSHSVGRTYLNSPVDIRFRINNADKMILAGNGRVGIGTTDPKGLLHVHGSGATINSFTGDKNGGAWMSYKSGSGSDEIGWADGAQPLGDVSIYANGSIVADGTGVFVATTVNWSDERSKKVIGRSNSKEDLELLSQIKVTDYTKIREGNLEKKIIAQELREVLPQAVSTMRGVVPTIFEHSDTFSFDDTQKELTIVLSKAHNLDRGDLIDIYTDKTKLEETEVMAVPSDNIVVVACECKPERVLVYGKWVNDVHMVDYDAVSMLNVSATQYLYHLIQDQQKKLEEQSRQSEELQKIIVQLQEKAISKNGAVV